MHFALVDPWPIIASFNNNFNSLNFAALTANEAGHAPRGVDFSFNRGQLEELCSLEDAARTWFIKNWEKWQEIDFLDEDFNCAGKTIEKIADATLEANSLRD